ncbi:hypothetical protein K443DRAFT_307237 [Laccaria amethystina LaAM-08-1]|uniref:Uncharacterized protein n=1 Tax=Laccaria amethystina LaAM-08-1 TaxID=1095629 RepID=A0A0C9X1Q1_9AGAR|nr:hypothetical protein K443DRAFT_307237 [Laccaria amethystina LaAM-08-1]
MGPLWGRELITGGLVFPNKARVGRRKYNLNTVQLSFLSVSQLSLSAVSGLQAGRVAPSWQVQTSS